MQATVLNWREVVEKNHGQLVAELTASLDSGIEAAVSGAVAAAVAEERSKIKENLDRAASEARTAEVESLNQVLRRLRNAGEADVFEILLRGAVANCAAQVVVLAFENNQARVVASHGIPAVENGLLLDEAPAILNAIESKDPVVALLSPTELSTELARVLSEVPGVEPGRKVYLFPVVVRQLVVAMLVASGVQLSAPLELLSEAAGMRLESLSASAVAHISEPQALDIPASATSGPRSWADLSPEDQKLHLKAQRMVRVRIAEIRLFQQNELQEGLRNSNIYGALQAQIDQSRDRFLQMFLSKSPTMVDYLHLEILHSLAHDDERLLGNNYPGPMV
jgi:hypothetical protein